MERYFITNAMAFFNGWNFFLAGKLGLCLLLIQLEAPLVCDTRARTDTHDRLLVRLPAAETKSRHTRPQDATEEIKNDYFKDEDKADKFIGGLFTLLVMPIATVVIIKLTFVLTDCEPPRPPPLLALSPFHAPAIMHPLLRPYSTGIISPRRLWCSGAIDGGGAGGDADYGGGQRGVAS